jgi:hypothetical protein
VIPIKNEKNKIKTALAPRAMGLSLMADTGMENSTYNGQALFHERNRYNSY